MRREEEEAIDKHVIKRLKENENKTDDSGYFDSLGYLRDGMRDDDWHHGLLGPVQRDDPGRQGDEARAIRGALGAGQRGVEQRYSEGLQMNKLAILFSVFLSLVSAFAGVGILYAGQLTGYIGVLATDGVRGGVNK